MSQKQKESIKTECENTKTIDGLAPMFFGFDYADLEKIEVKHIRDSQTVDTFWAYPEITRRGENGEVSAQARICREFDINDSYHFTVLGKQTFVLSDIKMGLHAGYTMFSEG
jgi:hypothetical protein